MIGPLGEKASFIGGLLVMVSGRIRVGLSVFVKGRVGV